MKGLSYDFFFLILLLLFFFELFVQRNNYIRFWKNNDNNKGNNKVLERINVVWSYLVLNCFFVQSEQWKGY